MMALSKNVVCSGGKQLDWGCHMWMYSYRLCEVGEVVWHSTSVPVQKHWLLLVTAERIACLLTAEWFSVVLFSIWLSLPMCCFVAARRTCLDSLLSMTDLVWFFTNSLTCRKINCVSVLRHFFPVKAALGANLENMEACLVVVEEKLKSLFAV